MKLELIFLELILLVFAMSVYCYPSSRDRRRSFIRHWSTRGHTPELNLRCPGVLRFLYAMNDTLLEADDEVKRNISRRFTDRYEEATVAGIPQNLDNTLKARCLPKTRGTSSSQGREDYVISYSTPTTASTNSDMNTALENADFTDVSTNKCLNLGACSNTVLYLLIFCFCCC